MQSDSFMLFILSASARRCSCAGSMLTFVKMVTEFRDADGALVAEAILTGVERQE